MTWCIKWCEGPWNSKTAWGPQRLHWRSSNIDDIEEPSASAFRCMRLTAKMEPRNAFSVYLGHRNALQFYSDHWLYLLKFIAPSTQSDTPQHAVCHLSGTLCHGVTASSMTCMHRTLRVWAPAYMQPSHCHDAIKMSVLQTDCERQNWKREAHRRTECTPRCSIGTNGCTLCVLPSSLLIWLISRCASRDLRLRLESTAIERRWCG